MLCEHYTLKIAFFPVKNFKVCDARLPLGSPLGHIQQLFSESSLKNCLPHFAPFAFNFQIVKAVYLLLIGCHTQSTPYSENRLNYLLVSYERCTHSLPIFCLFFNKFIK